MTEYLINDECVIELKAIAMTLPHLSEIQDRKDARDKMLEILKIRK